MLFGMPLIQTCNEWFAVLEVSYEITIKYSEVNDFKLQSDLYAIIFHSFLLTQV